MSEIALKEEARASIKNGIDKVVDIVALTVGPMGRNVVIAESYGASSITNDGVTVARSISLDDPLEDLGAHMVKEVATNTEELTGDGTSSSSILFQALVTGGIKMLAAGADPNQLKTGMSLAANRIVERLDEMAIPVEDNSTIRKVAVVSTNNDEELGGFIAEAFETAGDAGEVAVAESGGFDTYIKLVEGLRFDKGYMHKTFINNIETGRAELERPNILVTDKRINSSADLQPILEQLDGTNNSKLLVISDEIDSDVLYSIALSKKQGIIDVTCVKAPGFGDSRIEMLEDIAIVTGATFVGADVEIKKITLEDLGMAENVYAGKDETSIIGGFGKAELIEDRITNVKKQLSNPKLDDYPVQILQKRLTYLTGGVAVLYIGAASDTELSEKKYRIEDAVGATRSAISEGIVPGGGIALIRVVSDTEDFKLAETSDEEMGIKVVLEAVRKPFDRILKNAGLSSEVVLAKIDGKKNPFYGLNVKTNKYGDLLKLGVIDPVKVTKAALLNSVSVAGLMLTTEAAVYNKLGE